MSESKKYQNKEWLKHQYLALNRKVVDIAKECNVNVITIGRWRKKFDIPSRKFSSEAITKMSLDRIGKNTNEENPNWKGEDVGYHSLHRWVRKRKPQPKACENCGLPKRFLEIANISGEYKRDIHDYKYLCRKCHKEFDDTLNPLIEGGKDSRFRKGRDPWNKGLPSELQPNFGKKHSQNSIEKMRNARREYWRKKKEKEFPNEINPTQKLIEVYID